MVMIADALREQFKAFRYSGTIVAKDYKGRIKEDDSTEYEIHLEINLTSK